MQPRVTAILVAHSGAGDLDRTLTALSAQSRPPDAIIGIDVASKGGSESLVSALGADHVLTARDDMTLGRALARAEQSLPPRETDAEWLWLLAHDNTPTPQALAQLLTAVEIAPSVAVAGPKLMDADDASTMIDFGHTVTRLGRSVALVESELDQGQLDTRDDVLGVSASGMLVRRSLWNELGGFDPGLPSVDAALDFCIRARLAGHRVVLVPRAKVASAGGAELFSHPKSSAGRTHRLARAAQLHRRLAYSPAWAVPFHWLSLVPLSIVRSVGALIGKRPGAIVPELAAAFIAAFSPGIGAARRAIRRNRILGWGAISPLRMPGAEARERRAQTREAELLDAQEATSGSARQAVPDEALVPAGFISHGGLWVVAAVAIVGLLAYNAFLGAQAITGGGIRPLSDTVGALWANVGIGWRNVGSGAVGAADPFAAALAILGSLTFWNPTLSIVLVYLTALPLAALGGWFAARRVTRNPWLPALAGLLWAFSPPLLEGLADGRFGAVIAHLLLPWLLLAALKAGRSWASGAAASLLFAGVAAGSPSLIPALLVLFVVLLIARPTQIHRTIGIPIPALALFAPLIIQQLSAGNVLGLLADPGVPVSGAAPNGWHLALGDAAGTLLGWTAVLSKPEFHGTSAVLVTVALLAPLVILAVVALFLHGVRRSATGLAIALLGFATAVLATAVQSGSTGAEPVRVWAGSGLSLMWLGITVAALSALDALRRVAAPVSILAGLTSVALVIPTLGAVLMGTALVHPSPGRILPALVTAEATGFPDAGTLVIRSEGKAGISASLERGTGATLDDQSTLVSTKKKPNAIDSRLAVLAGNLATRSGFDFGSEFEALGISFVLVPTADDATYRSTVDAMDGNESLAPVGVTSGGLLWRYDGKVSSSEHAALTPTQSALARLYLIALAIVFGVSALMAIPTSARPRRHRPSTSPDEPATTFDEEQDHG